MAGSCLQTVCKLADTVPGASPTCKARGLDNESIVSAYFKKAELVDTRQIRWWTFASLVIYEVWWHYPNDFHIRSGSGNLGLTSKQR
jgi:hypothetical protein